MRNVRKPSHCSFVTAGNRAGKRQFSRRRLTVRPPRGKMKFEHPRAGVTQLVECNLAKVDVAGSNPVSRSILTEQTVPTSRID
jgi:hypothetical protein